MSRITVDTGVFVDYIDKKSPYHEQAKAIIGSLGKVELLLPPITLAEVCYVTTRILNEAGVQDAFDKAVQFVKWLYSHPAVTVVNDLDLHIETAKIKLKYRIALADCYVLALSRLKDCKAVFRKREKEMPKEIEKDFDVIFLEDY
ncbi:PIN domain-containing protein [Archaeoglobus sp.]